MKKKEIGEKGEDIATKFLETKGFNIIERNWRHKHLEVDIIASLDKKLHIVEVKSRTNLKYGFPEESISQAKMNHLKVAATAYLYQHPEWELLQFDVIAIMITDKGEDLFYIEDVYF